MQKVKRDCEEIVFGSTFVEAKKMGPVLVRRAMSEEEALSNSIDHVKGGTKTGLH